MIKNILRFEGLTIFLLSLGIYYLHGLNWLTFILLFFLPDLSMVGYLKDKRLGAITYNLIHNYILGFVLAVVGLFLDFQALLTAGFIITAHTGLDRFLGFGLKYKTNFKDTHLQRLYKKE